jgi:hypothetical protein
VPKGGSPRVYVRLYTLHVGSRDNDVRPQVLTLRSIEANDKASGGGRRAGETDGDASAKQKPCKCTRSVLRYVQKEKWRRNRFFCCVFFLY